MKILMVLTSHDEMGDSGRKTGFWLEEFVAPYYVFKDAGADITLASPKGGNHPLIRPAIVWKRKLTTPVVSRAMLRRKSILRQR